MNLVQEGETLPKALLVDAKTKILNALNQNQQLTWTQLLEKSELSKGALSKYLRKMIKEGHIRTTVDTTKRPPKTLYTLAPRVKIPETPEEFERWLQTEEGFKTAIAAVSMAALKDGKGISILKDRKLAKKLLKGYVATNFYLISVFIPLFILEAYKNVEEKTGDMKSEKGQKKRFDAFISKLNDYVDTYLGPYIYAFANTFFLNEGIAPKEYRKIGRQLGKFDDRWVHILEKHIKTEDL